MAFSPEQLIPQLESLPPLRRYWIALSGGLDSMVLLHAMARLGAERELRAVHVNHGLQKNAGDWARHCQTACLEYNIPLDCLEADARPEKGESPEAAARRVRYRAIEPLLETGDCLLTAQHQDDQAETLLLQLLRGAGPAGLASMPAVAGFGRGLHARPLLEIGRHDLYRYAVDEGLHWVEDESNRDEAYDRNFVRRCVMPLLHSRWPSAARTLSRAARHQSDALALIRALGEEDWRRVSDRTAGTVSVSAVNELTVPRQRNVLRHWFMQHGARSPSASVLEQVLAVLRAPADRTPVVEWGEWQLRRYRDSLYLLTRGAMAPKSDYTWDLSRGPLSIPELGLELRRSDLEDAGVCLPADAGVLQVRFRRGGERLILPGRSHSHSLKKTLQARGVPPWLRSCLPMIYDGDRLLAVFGLEPPIVTGAGRSTSV